MNQPKSGIAASMEKQGAAMSLLIEEDIAALDAKYTVLFLQPPAPRLALFGFEKARANRPSASHGFAKGISPFLWDHGDLGTPLCPPCRKDRSGSSVKHCKYWPLALARYLL